MYCKILKVMMAATKRKKLSHSVTMATTLHSVLLRKSVFKNITLLLFFFTVSWLPNYISELKKLVLGNLDLTDRDLFVEDFVVILFYSNLVFDPLIYGLGSKNFRRHTKELIRRLRTRRTSLAVSGQMSGSRSNVFQVTVVVNDMAVQNRVHADLGRDKVKIRSSSDITIAEL